MVDKDFVAAKIRQALGPILGLTPGIYSNPTITIGADGRITHAASGAGGGSSLLARCRTSANQTINVSNTDIVNYATKDYDPSSLVTTGVGWVFTAPSTAWYEIAVHGFVDPIATVWTAGDYIALEIWKNGVGDGSSQGTVAAYTQTATGSGTGNVIFLAGVVKYSLASGDTLQLRFDNSCVSANRRLNSGAAIEISKVT